VFEQNTSDVRIFFVFQEGSKTLGINPIRNLHFDPLAMTSGRVIVAPPLDVYEDGCELWKSTLVGHFVG